MTLDARGRAAGRRELHSTGRTTHAGDGAFPTFDGNPGMRRESAVRIETNGHESWTLTIHKQTRTHIDATLHVSADGTSVAGLAPEKLVCPLCVIDLTAKTAKHPTDQSAKGSWHEP